MSRLDEQIARQKADRIRIAASRPKTITPLEKALAMQREAAQPYIDRITGELATANATIAERDAEVARLLRCLRVLRATAINSGGEKLIVDIERALNGERL